MSNSRPLVPRADSKGQTRVTANTKGLVENRPDKENVLALQISEELEAESDFRFKV